MADAGGIGDVYMVKQCEKHARGRTRHGSLRALALAAAILMDMGCQFHRILPLV
jgi:hypothetical protein